ncbi:MAG: aldehyde dehydrogenase family protein [Candidatus Marinimicrobia bacterium]|nr:aldehyde dehydrogenase family protein [Candidatus Neomarinimicrobiota bacterium]MCH7763754.1 aldehyde dehydrogenase family protein [Candidatus Neomarinimicrobiota bacterium]
MLRKNHSVISPYFNKDIAIIPDSNGADLAQAVKKAKTAFPAWASTNIRGSL